jgi:hypothetical protein
MCEERAPKLQGILRSLAPRVPKVKLQRVEELFPNLMETMVSVLICLYGKDPFNLISGFTVP